MIKQPNAYRMPLSGRTDTECGSRRLAETPHCSPAALNARTVWPSASGARVFSRTGRVWNCHRLPRRGGHRATGSVPVCQPQQAEAARHLRGRPGAGHTRPGQASGREDPGGARGRDRPAVWGLGVWPDAGLGSSTQASLLPPGRQLGRGTSLDGAAGQFSLWFRRSPQLRGGGEARPL